MPNKVTKRMCLDLIAEKRLSYKIVKISKVYRLVGSVVESLPIFSWDRLYTQLQKESGGATS